MKMGVYKTDKISDFRDLILKSAKKYPTRTAFKIKTQDGKYREISYRELRDHFYRLCTHFINTGLLGKRIAICGKNQYGWVLSYLAAATVGVAVPIDKELSGEDIVNFLCAAECTAICAEEAILDKLGTKRILPFTFSRIVELADSEIEIKPRAVDSIIIKKDETRIIIFTSGTTGSSKGVCLSQHNVCANINSTVSVVKITEKDTTLSLLPLHHTYECTLNCLLILSRGATITYAESLQRVAKNLNDYSPSILVVVPEILKFLLKRIKAGIVKAAPVRYKALFEEKSLSDAMAALPIIVRTFIRRKVLSTLGGKMRLFIVGAADLDPMIVKDFGALGIRTLQGYGLTECAPLLAGNTDFYFNAASTGIAIPGVEIKIDGANEDGVGEICARGENVMLGYFNDEQATRAVLNDDGWFRTGDLGRMDPDGALYITGRRKNVIVTENGKNIYPEELETRLYAFAAISDVIVMAESLDGQTRVKARIFPNIDYIKEKLGHAPSADETDREIRETVKRMNSLIPAYKHIKVVEVLEAALEKTTTRKIKRYGNNMA